jgi:hypothetical protein
MATEPTITPGIDCPAIYSLNLSHDLVSHLIGMLDAVQKLTSRESRGWAMAQDLRNAITPQIKKQIENWVPLSIPGRKVN